MVRYQTDEINIIDDGNSNEVFFQMKVTYTYEHWKKCFKRFLERYDREKSEVNKEG